MSPQLTAIKHEQKNKTDNTIPIIKVLTENLESADISEDPDFVL